MLLYGSRGQNKKAIDGARIILRVAKARKKEGFRVLFFRFMQNLCKNRIYNYDIFLIL